MNTVHTIEDFYTQSEESVQLFDAFATKHALENIGKADHICYKCSSSESFEHIRALFEHESAFVYQSIISKRRIAIIKLKRGIKTTLGEITVLELSDQKPDGSQKEGFDHIEVYPVGCSYAEMIDLLSNSEEVIQVERPHHTTHDIKITEDFIFRCTEGPLLEKIRRTEMSIK